MLHFARLPLPSFGDAASQGEREVRRDWETASKEVAIGVGWRVQLLCLHYAHESFFLSRKLRRFKD